MIRKVFLGLLCSTFVSLNAQEPIKIVSELANGLTIRTDQNQKLWQKATIGSNLALEKKVEFSLQPNFRLNIVGDTDAIDLTDGKLSLHKEGLLRFDSLAVGWRYSDDLSNGIDLLVDLGKVEAVDKAVIRLQCGERVRNFQRSPKKIQTFVSKDGKLWYQTNEMIKLEPGEKDQSNFVNQFYLEENDSDLFVYPFELAIHADARFVRVRIVPDGGNLYSDELAIIQAETKSADFNTAYNQDGEKILTDGVVIAPADSGVFYIADNINAPNYFRMRDLRKNPDGKATIVQVVELPEGVTASKHGDEFKIESMIRNKMNYTRWSRLVPETKAGSYFEHVPWFFQAAKGKDLTGKKALFYAIVDGVPSHVTERTIKIITIPETTHTFRGQAVLSRTVFSDNEWPGLFQNLRLLGFNGIQLYPYHVIRGGRDFPTEYIAHCSEIRKQGFMLWQGDSAFHEMLRPFQKTAGAELYCQFANGTKVTSACPSYRGPLYEAEIERIKSCVAACKPDFIQWDIELWGASMPTMQQCVRCQATQKKSGKPWPEFLDKLSVEINRDITEAALRGANLSGGPIPKLYNYNRQALNPIYHGFEKWELNKQFVTGPMPSLYVAGSELRVHENISGNYAAQIDKSQRIILPVLTPNCYGSYAPYHLEQMLYEAMLNGAGGFLYYPWRGWVSPIYFYYHSQAMRNIITYQDLIFEGEIFTPSGSNPAMTYSGVKKSNEMLLLVGNYQHADERTTIQLPFTEISTILDVLDHHNILTENPLQLDVPKEKIRLIYIKAKE